LVRNHAQVVVLDGAVSSGIEVMQTWYRTQTVPRHSHPYLTLGMMLRGVGTLWLGGVTRTLRHGDIVVIAPGDVHTGGLGQRDELLSYTALHVPVTVLEAVAGNHQGARVDSVASGVIRDQAIALELRRVDRAVQGENTRDLALATEAAMLAVDRLLGRTEPGSGEIRARHQEPDCVRLARQLIDDCYAQNGLTSLAALGSAAGVSPHHLVREFTRVVGLSPHQYVIQSRVRRAAELLAGRQPPSDVAATVGFVDQSHLTAHFRRLMGMTPAAYQRGFGTVRRA
jgi:AraC-like DNA-binding protein/quercetin dioxygenase-like cupin family protein